MIYIYIIYTWNYSTVYFVTSKKYFLKDQGAKEKAVMTSKIDQHHWIPVMCIPRVVEDCQHAEVLVLGDVAAGIDHVTGLLLLLQV